MPKLIHADCRPRTSRLFAAIPQQDDKIWTLCDVCVFLLQYKFVRRHINNKCFITHILECASPLLTFISQKSSKKQVTNFFFLH